MDGPFAALAAAVEETALHERMRLEITHWHTVRGSCPPVPDAVIAAWRDRLELLGAAAAILRQLPEPAPAGLPRAREPHLGEAATTMSGPLWP